MFRVYLLNIARHVRNKNQTFNLCVLKCLVLDQASVTIKGRIFFEPLSFGCSIVIVKYSQTLSLELPYGISK